MIWIIITFIILCIQTFYPTDNTTVEGILTFTFYSGILLMSLTAPKSSKKQITMQKVIGLPILLFIILCLYSYFITNNTLNVSIIGSAILPFILFIMLGINRDLQKNRFQKGA